MVKYKVTCEDCELNETYDSENPPDYVVEYWGSMKKAKEQYSAKSAAKGKRDNHRMSAFRDYDAGDRHRPEMVEISKE